MKLYILIHFGVTSGIVGYADDVKELLHKMSHMSGGYGVSDPTIEIRTAGEYTVSVSTYYTRHSRFELLEIMPQEVFVKETVMALEKRRRTDDN